MSAPVNASPLAALLTAQLDAVFANGVVTSFLYYRTAVAAVPFLGVVDQFPARLSGVSPGDVRVRVRVADLALIMDPGPADYIVEADSDIARDVLSSVVEFGGAGLALQCRRRAQTVTPQLQGGPVGLALPCVTRAGRDALANLAAGVAVFQTDNTPGLRVYDGANWVRFQPLVD